MSELKGPTLFEIKQFIKDKTLIEFHTIDEKTINGHIIWYDDNAFHLSLENKKEITLLRRAVIYYAQCSG